MIASCPVCDGRTWQPVLSYEAAPVFQMLRPGESVTPDHFAPFAVVSCTGCGHLYDRAHSQPTEERMYHGWTLTNAPVNLKISQELEQVARWIGLPQYQGKHVIEIGGGTGQLARLLARHADRVTVFEPSAALRPEMLPEENITLYNRAFAPLLAGSKADFIVCRSVLEHVAEPLRMLREVREALTDDGCVYLEVPRGEFVDERAAIYDLATQHTQYFFEPILLALAAHAGLAPEWQCRLRNGHDFGVLLRPISSGSPMSLEPLGPRSTDLKKRITDRIKQSHASVAGLMGSTALYGANWHAISFLNLHQSDYSFTVALDDNPDFLGCALYSKEQVVPVFRPNKQSLADIDTVLIIAYLHEEAIVGNLECLGFKGRVVRVEPEFSVVRGEPQDFLPQLQAQQVRPVS